MRKLSLTGVLAALLCATFVPAAHSANNNLISIDNRSGYAVWVTTYKASDHRDGIIKAECFLPGRASLMSSTNRGGWVLFELKSSRTSCAEHSNMKTFERNVGDHAVINPNNITAN